jgi:hypothetical protein
MQLMQSYSAVRGRPIDAGIRVEFELDLEAAASDPCRVTIEQKCKCLLLDEFEQQLKRCDLITNKLDVC